MTLRNTESKRDEKDIKLGIDLTDAESLIPLFDSLTDQYGDPVNDLTREVISNALDATIKLPKSQRKPINITSPTEENPFFIVQDFGTGMTEEIIENNYTAFLASTKIFDPTQIGANGQGAKSPLAYTEEYTVETTCNGTTIEFYISRTSAGYKYGFLNVDKNSSKENGTKVVIPAKPSDNHRFINALYSYKNFSFDVPLVIDNILYEINDNYVFLSNLVLNDESGATGRVFVKKKSLSGLLNESAQLNYRTYGQSISYSLGGWLYNDPNNTVYGYNRDSQPSIIVELVPKVLDFNKSRSDIVNNEKSRFMHEKVTNFLKESETKGKFINVYKTFNNKMSLEFALELEVKKENFGNRSFKLGTDTYSFDDFTTNSNFNPYDLLFTDYTADSYASLFYPEPFYLLEKREYFYRGMERRMGLDLFVERYPDPYEKARVSKITSLVKDNFASGIMGSSSGATFAALIGTKSKINKVSIVNNVDTKALATILSSNRTIRTDLDYGVLIIAKDEAQINKNIKKFEEFLNISKIDASVLVEQIKKAKKNNSNTKSVKEISEKVFEFNNYGDYDKLIKTMSSNTINFYNIPYVRVQMTLAEAMEKNANLLISNSINQTDSLLKGMKNSDEIIFGDVFVFNDPRDLYAYHFKQLLDYDQVFINSSYKVKNAAAARELKEKRSFYGKFFTSIADGLSAPDIISAYVFPHNENVRIFLKEISLYILNNSVFNEDENLFNMSFSLMTAMDTKPSSDALQIVDIEFFKNNIENYSVFDKLIAFVRTLTKHSYPYYNRRVDFDTEAEMLNLLINNSRRMNNNSVIEQELFKVFTTRFLDELKN